MSKIVTLIACIFMSLAVSAQNTTGTLKGKLVDSVNKQSLKDASITVLDARDSSLEVFGLAKEDGSFSIVNIGFGAMIVQVKFNGYETVTKNITFSASNSSVNLGSITMVPAANELAGVTVSQSTMRMKGDTAEFNASSFKTKPNAVAEDLIRKMPGMEVAKDGSIKSQGEAVQRVLVDGKRFMNDDAKLATRTLPPDIIDKIQVFDDMSDQAKFSGFDDGNRVKTINITTKKDKKKGMFGKAVAGIGSKDDFGETRYEESFNFTKMNGDQQLTFMGQANNVNKQNFTENNIGGGRGGQAGGGGGGGNFGGGGGGGGGIRTVLSGGFNYRDVWSPKIDAYGSYVFNQPKTNSINSSRTQTILGADTSNYTDAGSTSLGRSENHRFSFNFEDRIDSMNSLIFRPNFALQSTNSVSNSSTETRGGKNDGNGITPIYKSVTNSSSYNSGYNVNGSNLQLRHRFAKRGRTLSLDLGFSYSENNGDGNNYSVNSFSKPFVKNDTINQHYIDSSRSYSFNPTISYTEPLSKTSMIELRYSYNYNNSTTINNTYRFDNVAQKFNKFDSLYSNSYKYNTSSSTANFSYRMQQTKYNFSVGTGLQFMDLESNNTTKNVLVKRNFINLTPTANFTYNFTKTRSLRIFYNGRTGQPNTSQLQPITTTTDSINFQIGNPDLKPQFNNNLRLLYSSIDPFTQRLIFATINGSITTNDIVSSVTQNPNGGRTTRYLNYGTTYNLGGYFSYGFPIKTPKSNLNLQTNINYSKNQSLLNGTVNATQSYNLSETVKWTTNLKNNFDMNLSTTFAYNPIRNSLSPSQNTNYMTQTLAADFTVYSNDGWTLASDFDYTHYLGRPVGYNTTVFLITPSIAKTFLKNKAGELRLSCFDLLNQNQTVSVSTNSNQIVNSISNNLKRYVMLTFTYNLRAFGQQQRGGQQNNMMRGQGMPGGNMMMMQGGMGGGNNGGGGRRGNND